ncbi:MAG: acetyl-CoA hydrolase/transferase family protein [Deltaproteobacteria bacterium]|nr:acetyl-CoA hydrolase/transferase family protein [Deltaproteobacteria bacterium]
MNNKKEAIELNWRDYYNSRIVPPEEAVKAVQSGDRVVLGHASGEPRVVVEELVSRAGELRDVEIVHMVAMGKSLYCRREYSDSFRHNGLFIGASTKEAVAEGRADYTPCFFSEIPSLFREGVLGVDVAMIIVSPPDKDGYVSLGISVDYTLQAALSASTVIAEVNPQMPRTGGKSLLHVKDIDYFVLSVMPLYELSPSKIGEVENAIGDHIAGLIKDGDCLQLGIGAIPDAVLSFLKDKKDLGIHTEMISDGVMGLTEEGVINGMRKQLHPGKISLTFIMGSSKLYRWVDNNPLIEAYPVDYTNDPFVIAQNDNVVSINSAIAVDLLGQVASDTIGPRQFSGVGGQVDFVRGAARSRGGRSIIALPATAKKGSVSRIVVALERGQSVTTSRNDVDYVATEYGIAHLKGKTCSKRAQELINIAAPEFRGQLRRECRELYGWL